MLLLFLSFLLSVTLFLSFLLSFSTALELDVSTTQPTYLSKPSSSSHPSSRIQPPPDLAPKYTYILIPISQSKSPTYPSKRLHLFTINPNMSIYRLKYAEKKKSRKYNQVPIESPILSENYIITSSFFSFFSFFFLPSSIPLLNKYIILKNISIKLKSKYN